MGNTDINNIRYSNGVKKQFYNYRDLTFNMWHRFFVPRQCYATDIDFVEYRYDENGNPVIKAILEVKRKETIKPNNLVTSSVQASFYLAKQANIKFFYIAYNEMNLDSRKEPDIIEKLRECQLWLWIPTEEEINKYKRNHKTPVEQLFKEITHEELANLIQTL